MIFMPFAVTCAYIIYISYGRVCAEVKTDSGKNAKTAEIGGAVGGKREETPIAVGMSGNVRNVKSA